MRRPWQVWLLYVAGLAVVIPAMIWLTWQVMYLDQAESLARRQAEREELIGRALWRMDAIVTPILAGEASRSDSDYQAVLHAEKNQASQPLADPFAAETPLNAASGERDVLALEAAAISPLLSQPPPFILLHFHWKLRDEILSPQCPTESERPLVCAHGIAEQDLNLFESRRQQLEISTSSQRLLSQLPVESWSSSRWDFPSDNSNLPDFDSDQQQAVSMSTNPSLSSSNPVAPQTAGQVAIPNDLPPPNDNDNPFAIQSEGRQADLLAPSERANDNRQRESSPPSQNPSSGNRKFAADDFEQRNLVYRQFARQSIEQSKMRKIDPLSQATDPFHSISREGSFRPIWVGGKLLFARRVQRGEETWIQGCWLDWNRMESRLRREVSEILPQFLLVPVFEPRQAPLNRVLATLPVQVEVPPLQPQNIHWSPVRLALVAAWGGLVLAALAAAVTLQGMILLNERRASFVSAVTHELRTPLTTFRMYAEMLAEGMVPDPERQRAYLTTLKTESDRLAHLVDNVLQYARLERGRPGKARQCVTLDQILNHVEQRLRERASQANLQLILEGLPQTRALKIVTDPAAVEQVLFNLVDNASKYAVHSPDQRLHLQWSAEIRFIALRIVDHGPGIPQQAGSRLFLPFSKSVNEAAESAPGVGLGLALSRRLSRALGGELTWEQTPGGGATFCLRLPRA